MATYFVYVQVLDLNSMVGRGSVTIQFRAMEVRFLEDATRKAEVCCTQSWTLVYQCLASIGSTAWIGAVRSVSWLVPLIVRLLDRKRTLMETLMETLTDIVMRMLCIQQVLESRTRAQNRAKRLAKQQAAERAAAARSDAQHTDCEVEDAVKGSLAQMSAMMNSGCTKPDDPQGDSDE